MRKSREVETEVKIPLTDLAEVKLRLQRRSFRISVPRIHELNDVYDTEDVLLRRKGMLLRLRQAGEKAVITWKGPEEPGPHKSRPELETTLGSLEILGQILEQLGYKRFFRYEKYRTEYTNGSQAGVVTVDETPVGNFIEIEGAAEWIDETAEMLGFSKGDYILESYGQLYLAYCRRHGLQPGDMVFASL